MNEESQNLDNFMEPDEPVDSEVIADISDNDVELAKASSSVVKKRATPDLSDLDDGEGQLTIDVFQTPQEIVVESPIAGVKPEDLDVQITSESVTIRGRREKEKAVKEEDYFYQECYWGRFSRSIILPQEVDADEAKANLKNGVLTIRLPKINRQKVKKLNVKFD
ncbi:MAG: Hsp20/alpha crystallin family protein [bacterium]|nr:Hsp20/alpha crystallin family protein [bacterium]